MSLEDREDCSIVLHVQMFFSLPLPLAIVAPLPARRSFCALAGFSPILKVRSNAPSLLPGSNISHPRFCGLSGSLRVFLCTLQILEGCDFALAFLTGSKILHPHFCGLSGSLRMFLCDTSGLRLHSLAVAFLSGSAISHLHFCWSSGSLRMFLRDPSGLELHNLAVAFPSRSKMLRLRLSSSSGPLRALRGPCPFWRCPSAQ